VVHKLWPAAQHQLAALFICLDLLPNYLSKCNALQLLRYTTALNYAFGKSEFHLVRYIYSIIRAQQAKLKCMLGVARTQWRWVGGHMRQAPAEKMGAVIFCDTKYTKIL